jgi:hypothetical protein
VKTRLYRRIVFSTDFPIPFRHHSKKSENITKAIDGLLDGYDNRLRPYFGGKLINAAIISFQDRLLLP